MKGIQDVRLAQQQEKFKCGSDYSAKEVKDVGQANQKKI